MRYVLLFLAAVFFGLAFWHTRVSPEQREVLDTLEEYGVDSVLFQRAIFAAGVHENVISVISAKGVTAEFHPNFFTNTRAREMTRLALEKAIAQYEKGDSTVSIRQDEDWFTVEKTGEEHMCIVLSPRRDLDGMWDKVKKAVER